MLNDKYFVRQTVRIPCYKLTETHGIEYNAKALSAITHRNCVTAGPQRMNGLTKCFTDIHADPAFSHTDYQLLPIGISRCSKTAKNAASDGFGSNFSGAAFRLPHQLVGILFYYIGNNQN